MVRWLAFRLGLAALLGAVSGCAVIWDAGEIGEPLETPAAARPARTSDANAPAVVSATTSEKDESERSGALHPPPSTLHGPTASADDAGLEQLIAQGRRQGTLSARDEARLREDMADVSPELRRFLALNGPTTSKPNAARKSDDVKPTSSVQRDLPASAKTGRMDNPFPPLEKPIRELAAVKPAKTSTVPHTGAEAATAKPNTVTASGRTASAANPVANEPVGGEWHVMLAATIRSLEESLASSRNAADSDDAARRQAQLRMLYLIAGRRDDALRPITEADPEARQFWTDWLYGTATYLDPQTENPARRATLAVRQIEDAIADLAAQANLEVCNLAFCRRVTSFGVYEAFAAPTTAAATISSQTQSSGRYVFGPNQEVLLYTEVRNFTSRHTDRGYHTALRPSYQIFDAAGRRLGTVTELSESHDYCQHRRRDFFVRYHLYLPSRIDPGEYKLKLTIEDIHSTKVAEGSVEFSIGAGG